VDLARFWGLLGIGATCLVAGILALTQDTTRVLGAILSLLGILLIVVALLPRWSRYQRRHHLPVFSAKDDPPPESTIAIATFHTHDLRNAEDKEADEP
jgi:hypothetical protein